MSQPSLFDPPALTPMTRTPDHPTSERAADKVRPTLSQLQRAVYEHIQLLEPVTALELEELDIFAHLAPSTVRKRVSELAQRGRILGHGEQEYRSKRTGKVAKAIAWGVMPGVPL